jgi:HEAT repeat protein
MKQTKIKLLVGAIVCLCITITLAFSVVSYGNRTVYRTMTRAETAHCDQIAVSVNNTGVISTDDLSWALQMLHTPSWTGETFQTQERHLEIMVALKNLRNFAPGQREQLYEATFQFLTSPDKPERIGAMAVMRAIKDKRAIPSVIALLSDQDDFTRQMAHKTLPVLETPGISA